MKYPRMMRVKQEFEDPRVGDLAGTVAAEMERVGTPRKIKPGDTVAVAAGSRGIHNIDVIVKAVIDELVKLGAKPFILPAMGSHGGGTAESQKRVLEGYGISEQAMGVPIKSSMEVVEIGETPEGWTVYLDSHARAADHIVVINRLKAHTAWYGDLGSGLLKMMTIGLGKRQGATNYHRYGMKVGLEQVVKTIGQYVLDHTPIAFGLGIVENGYDHTAIIEAVPADSFLERETDLMKKARRYMARLPFKAFNLLIVDEMGKDISGTGIDTNVISRIRENPEIRDPDIMRIFVRGLTEKTHGNATGIGFADFTTTRLVEGMNRHDTYVNSITAKFPNNGKIPIYFDTDREVLDAALETLDIDGPDDATVVHIKNTLLLGDMWVSEAMAELVRADERLTLVSEARDMEFDAAGNLADVFS